MLVGTMIASEVPTQSCMRTSSGTPSTRKPSNSTGTMTAPPPMPNRPAISPVTTPPPRTPATSHATSPIGTPKIMSALPDDCASGRSDARRLARRLAHERERGEEGARVRARLDAFGGEEAAKRARPRHGVKQAEHMARDGAEPHAARDLALDIGDERKRRLPRRDERR